MERDEGGKRQSQAIEKDNTYWKRKINEESKKQAQSREIADIVTFDGLLGMS